MMLYPAGHKIALADMARINGNPPVLGSSDTEQYQLLFGSTVATTSASGVVTINPGFTKLAGFVAMPGDITGPRTLANIRTGWPVSGQSVDVRRWLTQTGATVNSTSVRTDWVACGTLAASGSPKNEDLRAGKQLLTRDFDGWSANLPILGSHATNRYQWMFGTWVGVPSGGGDVTIPTPFSTVAGFVAWNGDGVAKTNMVIGDPRTAGFWPVTAGTTSIVIRSYVGTTGAVVVGGSARFDYFAWGVMA
jgi:hypothetical protein